MEKRKYTRFQTQDNAFAALLGDFIKVGKIYDISLNGLGFRYLTEKMSDEKFAHVDVFLTDNGFHLPGLPCTVIYDIKESTSSSTAISPHRCGLKFLPLKEEDQNKLEFFINNYTTGEIQGIEE